MQTTENSFLTIADSVGALTTAVSREFAADDRFGRALQILLPRMLEAAKGDLLLALEILHDECLLMGLVEMMMDEPSGCRVPLSRIVKEYEGDALRLNRLCSGRHPLNKRLKEQLAQVGVSLIARRKNRGEPYLVKAGQRQTVQVH